MRGVTRREEALVLGATAASILILVASVARGIPPSDFGFCSPTPSVVENGSIYRTCVVSLDWNNVWYSPKEIASTNFEGVYFVLYGYNTYESPVVNITGQVHSGTTQSILVTTWCGPDCSPPNVTLLSSDGAFGTSWDGGSTITLLVRSL